MRDQKESVSPRRTFLKGAASVVGAGVVGPGSALASALQLGSGAPPINIALWDGKRFVAADKLTSGDAGLGTVRVTMKGFGKGGPLVSVDTVTTVTVNQNTKALPFQAWSAPPTGVQSSFTMPVGNGRNMHLKVRTKVGQQKFSKDVTLATNGIAGPKLREGTYVVTASPIVWGSHTLDLTHPESPLVGPPVPYLLITIERA